MSRRLVIPTLAFLLAPSFLFAGLRIGAPIPIPPEFQPSPTGAIDLTHSDGLFLAGWIEYPTHDTRFVRLDADGDPLDVPPLPLARFGRSTRALPEGSGWLLWSRDIDDDGNVLTLDRLSREGSISAAGQFPVPAFQNLSLAGADGRYAVLSPVGGMPGMAAIITFDSSIEPSAPLILPGEPVAIEGRDGRFAALFEDRVVIVTSDLQIEKTIPLPPLVEPRAIVSWGDTFGVVGVRGASIDVSRIDGETLVSLASISLAGAGPDDPIHLAADSSGDALLVLWSRNSPWGLFGARIDSDGSLEGPVALGNGIWTPAVEGDSSGWLTTAASPATPGVVVTRRIERHEPLSHIEDDLDPVVWRADSQYGSAIAISGDVALAIWLRSGKEWEMDVRGARFDARGERLDDEDLRLPSLVRGAEGRDGGFLLHSGSGGPLAWEFSAAGGLDEEPIRIAARADDAAIDCAGETCLAAWRENPAGIPPSVRIARVEGRSVLDPGGVGVAFGTANRDERGKIGIASDGTRFLVAWSRLVSGGTIVTAALVDPTDALDYRTFDVLAVGEVLPDVRVLWTGAVYEIFASGRRQPELVALHRLVRVSPEGAVIEGEESGWAGWPLSIEGDPRDETAGPFFACGSTYFAASGISPGTSGIYEILPRSARLVGEVPFPLIRDVACFDGRACLAIGDRRSFDQTDAFLLPMSCKRQRLVAR